VSKILIVVVIVRRSGIDALAAWRVALLVAVGGEFGFALIAIALDANVIDTQLGQIALTSVFFSLIAGSILIRFNHAIATRLAGQRDSDAQYVSDLSPALPEQLVLIGGYGRVGHTLAVLLHERGVPFIAFDSDPGRVAQGRADGHQVVYGDIADAELLASVRAERAALVIITVDDSAAALTAVSVLANYCPHVPVIARARDLESSARLLAAGATHAYPEAIEASLRLGATALKMLAVPDDDIDLILQGVRDWDYKPVMEADAKR
jgi:CPA2 family monovalent cation:H+ antiporter-2